MMEQKALAKATNLVLEEVACEIERRRDLHGQMAPHTRINTPNVLQSYESSKSDTMAVVPG